MHQYTRIRGPSFALPMAVGAAMLAAACTKSNSNTATNGQDTTLQLAGRDTLAQPSLHDVGVPSATRRRHATSAKDTGTTTAATSTTTSHSGIMPAGTTVHLASNARVCTNTYHVGQRFTAVVTEAAYGPNGVTIPPGATVDIRVTHVKPSNNITQAGQIGLAIDDVKINGHSSPVSAAITSAATQKVNATSTAQQVTKVGIGTAAGAILGRVIGGDAKSTLIGAAAGAAAGGGAAYATTKYNFCIPENGPITIKLDTDTPITS